MEDISTFLTSRLRLGQWGRWPIVCAVALYFGWATILIFLNPGFQYDEALQVLGSVHMLNSSAELTLPHDPDTWLCAPGLCLPLMTVRYAGAIKEYLCLPLFAVFGTYAQIVRLLSMFLGGIGIFGIGTLLARQVGPWPGAVAALLIAINPAYLDMTVIDNGTISVVMAALGLLCLGLAAYLRKRTAEAALWVGAAMGFGVWARANFIWIVAAVIGAAVILLGRQLFVAPVSHWLSAAAGACMAASPFIAYQVHSRGGTWQALSMFVSHDSFQDRLSARLIMFSETLLSDREHHAIWNGAPIPDWQRWLFPTLVAAACIAGLVTRHPDKPTYSLWSKLSSLVFLILFALLFLSRLEIAEHHLIVLVPIAAAVVTLTCASVMARYRWSVIGIVAVAVLYLGSALYWQIATIRGVARTGGVGVWSDAIYELSGYLHHNYADREVKILDWGLQDNLYVLSGGSLHSREIWPDSWVDGSDATRRWKEEIKGGGVFLLHGPDEMQFPKASLGFLQVLADARPVVHRHAVRERNGTVYADIYQIEPNTLQRGPEKQPSHVRLSTSISLGDANNAGRLSGFYEIEENRWRWSKREFSIVLDCPESCSTSDAHLVLNLYMPDSNIRAIGPVTLTGHINGHALPPETYAQPGEEVYRRDVGAAWMVNGANKCEFTLDNALKPSASEPRELGIVVVSASLEP